jgi:LacI family transcriptional regulator
MPLRILLALGWYDHRLHRGIERYAREHGWSIAMDVTRNRTIPWGWDGDGILAWLGADDAMATFVGEARIPTVDFSLRRQHLKFTRVVEDTAGTARIVAEHFLARGVQNFLFYSDRENWVYDERGTNFERELRTLGHEVRWLRWHESAGGSPDQSEWKRKHRWLKEQIQRVEKTVGIFAACDELAAAVLDACESTGIRVPEEAAIVGAGDSLLAVNSMSTPISSVDINLEMVGYRGAQELDRLIRRQTARSSTPIRIPPAEMIVRKSSDVLVVGHPGIARSVRFLLDNAHNPIRVEQLAGAASMSISAFHRAFAEHMGRAPGAEIQRTHVEQARRLLRGPREKLSTIASACGYRSINSLSVAFKKATGMSPGDYRTMSVIPDSGVRPGKTAEHAAMSGKPRLSERRTKNFGRR